MISCWFYRKLNSSFRFLAFRIVLLCFMAVEEIIGSNLVIANLTILRVVGFVCVKFNVSIVEQKNSFEKDIPRIQRLNFLICIIELSTVFRFDRYVWIVLAKYCMPSVYLIRWSINKLYLETMIMLGVNWNGAHSCIIFVPYFSV